MKLLIAEKKGDYKEEQDQIVLYYQDSNLNKSLEKFPKNDLDEVKILSVYPSEFLLDQIFRILKPKQKVSIHNCIPSREIGQSLAIDLKIHGFIDIMVAKDPVTDERFAVCQKPEWDVEITAPINIKPKIKVEETPQKAWKMSVTDLSEDDLIDEDSLLIDNIIPNTTPSDCGTGNGTGKRRACANCSCGLAEEEAKESTVQNPTVTATDKKSSCGNCYKGDAFRCGGCPFLGKPAFEPGKEKVILSMSDDI